MNDQPTLFPVCPYEQQMELMRKALAMNDGSAEWMEFLELVREMRKAQRDAAFGIAWSKQKREKAERFVDDLIREFDEVRKPSPLLSLDFTKGGVS